MDKYVLIFAKTKYSKTPYDQWLKDSGVKPLIITSNDFAAGYEHIEHVFSFDLYDQNGLIEQKALELIQHFNVIGIFARAEADVLRAARLRELSGIPGQWTKSAEAFRNKIIMKDHLQGSKVKLPHYKKIFSAIDVITFVHEHGYPVVIKPCSESGSSGTLIVKTEEELDLYLSHGIKAETEIETFVDGKMHHIDGLIIDGELKFIQPFEYINDCLSYRKNEFWGSRSLSPRDPLYERLVSSTKEVLTALPKAPNMAFHCELWVTPDSEIVFCEIASRTGGGMISSTIASGLGLNLDQEWFLAEIGQARRFRSVTYRPTGSINLPPQVGVLRSLPEETPEFVIESQYAGEVGQSFNGGVKSGLFLAGYVVKGDSEAEILERIVALAPWFENLAQWERGDA